MVLIKINKKYNNIIPEGIITRPASAELRPDQEDAHSLPEYETLDAILEKILTYRATKENLLADGHSLEDVEKVLRLYSTTEYKRFQFCPIIKVKTKSFGFGYRIPLTKNLGIYK